MDVDGEAQASMTNGNHLYHSNRDDSNDNNISGQNQDEPTTEKYICEECEDRRSQWDCDACGGGFCDVCFYALHRKGKRALHKPEKIHRPAEGGGLLKGWIGPRLPAAKEVNPDMHDRCGRSFLGCKM